MAPHGLIGVHDLSLLGKVIPHLHDLVHVLVLELYNLLKRLLVHSDHLHVLLVVLVLLLDVPAVVLLGWREVLVRRLRELWLLILLWIVLLVIRER